MVIFILCGFYTVKTKQNKNCNNVNQVKMYSFQANFDPKHLRLCLLLNIHLQPYTRSWGPKILIADRDIALVIGEKHVRKEEYLVMQSDGIRMLMNTTGENDRGFFLSSLLIYFVITLCPLCFKEVCR